jgi:pyruvate dehydrogenase E2 component (dihydrolipoamide acetyltransferase)
MSKVTMPKAGQSMEEGSVLRWHRQEGEAVAKGEILLEIDTDKAAVEVESPQAGVLRKILCPEGTTVPVLAPIAIIAGADDDISAELSDAQAELDSFLGGEGKPARAEAMPLPTSTEPAKAAPPVAGHESAGKPGVPTLSPAEPGGMKVSPAARKMAQNLRVDLTSVGAGSGPEGRILTTDVARAAAETAAVPKGPPRRPLTGMRKAIARTMQASKQSIPHFYVKLTIDAGPLHAFYRTEKQKYPCTINDILTLACARVIREFPAFRSRIENEEVVEFPAAGIGVAVGMDEGLVVPVVVGAEDMSLGQLAVETQRIVEAARNGKVVAMGQGVFTITNLGGFGVEEFSAIINPPEAAILAVGSIRESVIVQDGGIRPARVMTMTLSADHRLIDGLMAARFLRRLKEVLEAPDSLRDPVRVA